MLINAHKLHEGDSEKGIECKLYLTLNDSYAKWLIFDPSIPPSGCGVKYTRAWWSTNSLRGGT